MGQRLQTSTEIIDPNDRKTYSNVSTSSIAFIHQVGSIFSKTYSTYSFIQVGCVEYNHDNSCETMS